MYTESGCMTVCARVFYGDALQGAPVPPKTLPHSAFRICSQEEFMITLAPHLGRGAAEQKGEGHSQAHAADPRTQTRVTSPARLPPEM